VFKFSSTGIILRSWDIYAGSVVGPRYIAIDGQDTVYVTANAFVFKYTTSGERLIYWLVGDALRSQAYGIGVRSGRVYVADEGTDQVQVFDRSGRFVFAWGSGGRDPGQFASALGIAVTENEQIFVSDDSRVQEFDASGGFLSSLGSGDDAASEFAEPSDVAVDSKGNLYVIDSIRRRIRKYADLSTPVLVPTWGRLKLLYR